MATFNKYECFEEDLHAKVHDLFGTAGSTADVLKVMLSNTAPVLGTHKVRADVAELAATGRGDYPSGGFSIANVGTRSGGTVTVVATDVTITAAGGTIGPFRYAIIYNDTPTSPADPLVAEYDYGSSITLADGESILVDFGANLFTAT